MSLRLARLAPLGLLLCLSMAVAQSTSPGASSGAAGNPGGAGSSTTGKPAAGDTGIVQPPPVIAEPQPKAWDYYPRRPQLGPEQAALSQLLDEIEGEAEHLVPLFGQAMFRSAAIERSLNDPIKATALHQPSPSFRMAPGDKVSITFFNRLVAPTTVDVTVQPDGNVAFDPVGVVAVNGLTVAQFEERMTTLIRAKGPREATVEFAFTQLHSLRVRVTGDVRRPASAVLLNGYASVADALAACGGPTAYGSLRQITLLRGAEKTTIDLYSYLLQGDPTANPELRDGDVLYVPVAKRLVLVAGEVKRVARFELLTEQTVRDALALAGGLSPRGARLQMERVQQFDRRTLVDLDVQSVLDGKADLTAVEPLRDGDLLRVEPVAEKSQLAVLVSGAVGKSGEFGFRDGMVLADALRLAQGVARSGYGAVGTIRRLKADGQIESINFVVADVLTGGAAARTVLQPGDEVVVPQPEERGKLTVSITGAVYRPSFYETTEALTVGDLLARAGGPAPGADLANALLTTGADGPKSTTRLDLSAVPRGGQPAPNPTLRNGDEVNVPFLVVLHVQVTGQVRTPGAQQLTAGMTVKDLLQRAGGRLPQSQARAELRRVVANSRELEKVFVNLDRAEAGDAVDNLVLRDGDQLVVFAPDQIGSSQEPFVAVQGPVLRPGPVARSKGMRVSDLLREVGLRPEADRDEAIILRRTANGLQQMVRFSPTQAVQGEGPENPELADGDLVEFQAVAEVTVRPAMATVSGAVYRPGPVALALNMTVDDVIKRAGGFAPDAYRKRVILRRKVDGGRSVDLPLDMTAPLGQPVQRDDLLIVLTYDQAQYREGTVQVLGDVQRPGIYERTDGMTVSQVLFMAGGLIREPALSNIEVARPAAKTVLPFRPDAVRLLAGDPAQDLVLQDGDRVYVRSMGPAPVREVLLKGEVVADGFYPILSGTDSLRGLLQRAQLRKETAFIEGLVLLRRVDEVVEPQVARYASDIFRSLEVERRRNDLTILLSASKVSDSPAVLDRLVGSTTTIPSDAVTDTYTDLFELKDRQRLTSAVNETWAMRGKPNDDTFELPDTLKRYVRVAVDPTAIESGKDDLLLRPNDIVVVPAVPQTVLVQGAVNSNMAQPFVEGHTVMQYIEQVGGARPRADLKQILVVRANGSICLARPNTIVQRGDMILVQPQPVKLPTPPGAALQQVQAVAQVIGGLATTVLAVSNAVK